jgi:hypothetical protein
MVIVLIKPERSPRGTKYGEFLEGRSPSYTTTSPSPLKERGIKGVR